MEIKLNLLSDAKKSEVRRRKQYRLIVWQEIIFSSLLVFYLGVLFSIDSMLRLRLENIENAGVSREQEKIFKEIDLAERKFSEVNGKVEEISRFQREHIIWSSLFFGLEAAVPRGISIDGLTTEDRKISLSGKADTRDTLLKFQDALNGSECFRDAKVPLSDLFAQNNVDFQMDMTIKKECLKKGNL